MCLDVYAPGHVVTIPFLHQQVWYETRHNELDTTDYCDCFITNESGHPIEQLRLHFSSFVRPSDVTVCSGMEIPSQCRSSWFGQFGTTSNYESSSSRVTVRHIFEEPDTVQYTGRILKGSFCPKDSHSNGVGLIPVAGQRASLFMRHMQELDLMVLDLHLDDPLQDGDAGWLRIRVCKSEGGKDAGITSLPQSPLLREPDRFLTRRRFVCPVLLREKVRRSVEGEPYKRWQSEILVHGLEREGTLTRIEDHRITLVFPKDVETCDIGSSPHETIIPVAPYPISTAPNHYALRIMSGSKINHNCDIVSMAVRILDYMRSVYPKATVEHLVNRFGSDHQEAVGVLIDAMIATQLLNEVADDSSSLVPDKQPCYAPVSEDAEHVRLIELRRHFTTVSRSHAQAKYAMQMRDMHPFRISFSMAWTAYAHGDLERLQLLRNVMDFLEKPVTLESPRHAVIVACSRYDHHYSPEVVRDIAEALSAELKSKGQFRLLSVLDPNRDEDITNAVYSMLSSMNGRGVFLFWFIGHGARESDSKVLRLLHRESRERLGIRYSVVNDLLKDHPQVKKIIVLDCCHAALALEEQLAENTAIWPTTEVGEDADTQKECGVVVEEGSGEIGNGHIVNFTHSARALLSSGDEMSSSGIFTFGHLFEQAAKNSPSRFTMPKSPILDTTPLAVNIARVDEHLRNHVFRRLKDHARNEVGGD